MVRLRSFAGNKYSNENLHLVNAAATSEFHLQNAQTKNEVKKKQKGKI